MNNVRQAQLDIINELTYQTRADELDTGSSHLHEETLADAFDEIRWDVRDQLFNEVLEEIA